MFEEKSSWIEFEKESFDKIFTEKLGSIHIDTRDFFYVYSDKQYSEREKNDDEIEIDFQKISKYKKRFYFTKEEVSELIFKFYTESGGKFEWRFLELETNDEQCKNWNLKYLRIFRVENEKDFFIVCNDKPAALRKLILFESKINQKLLSAH